MTCPSVAPRCRAVSLYNYPVAVTDRNRERLHALGVALAGWCKVAVTWLFAYIAWIDVRVGLGLSTGLGWFFLPAMLLGIGAPIAIVIVQMRRAGGPTET
jgi:hypothetical protein